MPDTSPKRSRAWIGYIVVTLVALAFSGISRPETTRSVTYDEALSLVDRDEVASASVEADEVVLETKAAADRPGERVKVTRLPAFEDEPLIRALIDKHVRLDAKVSSVPFWLQAFWWIAPLILIN